MTLDELIATPRASCAYYPSTTISVVTRGQARMKKLLPDPIPGMEMDRIELPAHARRTGIPPTPGTREYLTCAAGAITLVAAGEPYRLTAGDLIAFRGDQRHSYDNPLDKTSVGYSVVVLANG